MQRPASPRRIALLGAESTGKSHLATALAERLRSQGLSTVVVPEVLRGWCEREGRTPRAHEQAAIALEQARQVLVCDGADVVIADTTPLMTAVYSHLLFADGSLYEFSLHHQRVYDATLVTGLDLPWMADGLMRDGPQVREPVDHVGVLFGVHPSSVAVVGCAESRDLAHHRIHGEQVDSAMGRSGQHFRDQFAVVGGVHHSTSGLIACTW